ncbi:MULTISPECIES: plasmid pRiA4b ORF-3 family protein [unclassified Paracoccus (in: a-proteobacteria)]|uniref:plasmid pRiA4b ORF-3 family protein n=1 Tax=unclassified Paracoccus (in: a-proteobacteria) TaxID=2688777 RepID=UPI0020CAD403|nr:MULTISPECIES: plasmid pRiA4b ORF-3 family protein [unclassified Paracoccus (in: a-proteobacteria)]
MVAPSDWTLDRLHPVLQAAFGWIDSHLHEFRIGGLRYGDPALLDDGFAGPCTFGYTEVRLQDSSGATTVSTMSTISEMTGSS